MSLFSRATSRIPKGERFGRLDLRYLFAGGSVLTFGQVISSVTVFFLSIAFANLLPKEIYGQYKYLLALAGLLSMFALPGMITALARSVAKGYEGSLVPATLARVRTGMLGLVVGMLIALYYYLQGNPTLAVGLLIISAFLPFFDTFTTYAAYLQGKRSFTTHVTLGSLVQLAAAGALITALLLTDNLFVLIGVYFASYTLLRFMAWLYTVRLQRRAANRDDPGVVSYGKHLTAVGLMSQVAAQADILLLFHFLGPAYVAVYAIALAPTEQIKHFLGTLQTLLLPRFAMHARHAVRSDLLFKGTVLFVATSVIIVAYLLAAPLLFSIFFPQYVESVLLTQILAISLLNIFFLPSMIYLEAHGYVKEQYYTSTATAVLQIGLMYVGILTYGLLGLVLARVVTRFATGGMGLYFALRTPA